MQAGTEAYRKLKSLAKNLYGTSGGITSEIQSSEEALDFIMDSIDAAGYKGKVFIAIDAAFSEFYKEGKYDFTLRRQTLTSTRDFLANKWPSTTLT